MINTVSILGLEYKIHEVSQISKSELTLGQIDYVKQEILIDASLSKEKKEIVLLHEIIHGILEELFFIDISDNENAVQGLAVALHHIIKSQTIFS